MSAQDKLDRRAAKHGLGSDERKRKIQKAKDFFSKPVPTYSKDELRKMGHPVETTDAEVKKKQDFLDRLRGKPPVKKEGMFDIVIPAPKGSNKNTDKQVAAKAARRAARRAKTDTTKIDKAVAKDKARSASGSLKRTDDHRRKNYQTGKSGAYFSKYESSAEYGKSMDRIRDKEKNAAIKPKDRETLGKLADLMKKQKRTEEKMYSVKYTHPTDKKSGKTTGPLSKAAANKKAAMGNRVDRVGGKYTVIPHVEASGQEFTAVPTKTRDVSQADRLTIAKMDAIMKKRSKDKRQKEQNIHFVKVDEATMADRTVLRAVRIAKDMAGNHTGASKRIEKMKKGLSDHPKVKDALRTANESVSSADKKPQNFRDPATGKLKVRMIPVDRDVVRGNDKARVVRKKRFKNMRKEQMATGNSRVGKDGRDAFMKAFKDVQKTAAEIQKKKDADKK